MCEYCLFYWIIALRDNMSTVDKVGNRQSCASFAQLYTAIRRKESVHKKFLQLIIEKQNGIDYKIPSNDFLELHHPELIGCTALHFAFSQDNFESFDILLKYHADFNVRNYRQMTVLRRAVEENFNKREIMNLRHRFNEYGKDFTVDEVNAFVVMQRTIEGENFHKHDNWRLWGKFEDKYVNSILSHCLENEKFPEFTTDVSLLHAACMTNNKKAIDFLLKNGADVHQPSSSSIFEGFTPLHFAVKYSSAEVVKTFLANDVNLFSCESKSLSPVGILVDQNLKILEWLHAKNKLPYKNALLDYVENEEKLTSIMEKNVGADWTGFSGLHIACTMKDASTIKVTCSARGQLSLDKFLEGDHWHSYDRVSSIPTVYPWSGYTALHFAAFFNIDTAKLLINSGADVEARNKYGVTPLHILETRATIDDLHFIVSHKESWKSITLSDRKTKLLDLISSMKNLSAFENFLDEFDINLRIPEDSPLWPGYTALHLVVTFSETVKKVRFLKNMFNSDGSNLNVEYESDCREQDVSYRDKIELCLQKNADVTIQDARGRTPINLAFRQKNMDAVNLMLQHQHNTINPTDCDNLSHLHIACLTKNYSLVEKLLANGADVNAAIKSTFKWHCDHHHCTSTDVFDLIGSTPLHLSLENLVLVKVLLGNGADVNAKDALNLTPLHRIFILQHLWEIGNELFKVPKTVRYICRRGRRVGIPCFTRATEMLHETSNELLSSENLRESIVDNFGLSHLHIAANQNNADAVRKLLDLGSDINSVIRCTEKLEANHPLFVLNRYDGYTPLDTSYHRYFSQVENPLLERGADFLVARADGMNRLFDKLKPSHPENIVFYVNALKESEKLRGRLRDEFGWTILHVACQLVDIELLDFAFSIGVDVNLRTKEDSPMHPGCTALHILIVNCNKTQESEEAHLCFDGILTALLANGADVMLTDVHGNTALHPSDFVRGSAVRSYSDSTYTGQLLRHVKNFSINPVNHEGISVFHIACIKHDVDAITNFLDHGVDINRPIEFFHNYSSGCTPLHLAARSRAEMQTGELESRDLEPQLQTIALLLKRGADVNAEDDFGNTPLHAATRCDSPRDAVLEMIVGCGADINAKNVYGKTPLESLLSSHGVTRRELDIFLKKGCRLNAFNDITQVGYMSLLVHNSSDSTDHDVLKLALSCPSIHEVDYKGRTAIHNVVSSPGIEDVGVIEYFIENGCDIDRQDRAGMTALHLAALFRNSRAVEGLLCHGCDVNVLDFTGRTAFAYTLETESLCDLTDAAGHNHLLAIESFTRFIYHMMLRGLHVNDVNKRTFTRAFNEFSIDRVEIEEDYRSTADVRIGNTAFTLDDFFSETNAIVRYSKIAQADREVFERFFANTVEDYDFHKWRFLCKLQYRKALRRADLVESAKDAINFVMGFPLPDLCYEVIEKFLTNTDLENLIVATTF